MAKTVSQIMAELDKSGGYAADRQLLQKQLSALPGQSAAQIKGLDAQLARANDNILQAARSRGLGFSGPPIQEQLQYAATEYAPALARVKQSMNDQRTGILGSLNSLSRDMRSQAQSIFENERNFREQRRQWEADMAFRREQERRSAAQAAAQAASAGSYLSASGDYSSGGGGSTARQQAIIEQAQRERRLIEATEREKQAKAAAANRPKNSSGNFFNDYGRSIAQYGPLALVGKGWGW